MNIMFCITAYLPSMGGAQVHTHRLAQELAREHKVEIITHWDAHRTDWLLGTTLLSPVGQRDYEQDGIPVHRLGISTREKFRLMPYVLVYYPMMEFSIPILAKNLRKKMRLFASRADLIHNVRIGREPLSYAAYLSAREHGVPFVFTPLHHPRWSGWLHRMYHRLYRSADALIALTQVEKETLIQLGVREERITVTGIGPILAENCSGSRFRREYNLGNDPVVLFIGQKYSYKGVAELLEAAPWVWKRFPEARFVFIGPRTNYSRSLFSTVKDGRIIELDTVSLETKTDALDACSMLCVPSSQESFGGVYTEAWTLKKPVIGCSIPAVAEVIADGEDGFLVRQEAKEIADRIVSLIGDSQMAERMGNSGQNKVETQYSWENITGKTINVYKSLLE